MLLVFILVVEVLLFISMGVVAIDNFFRRRREKKTANKKNKK